MNQINKVKFFFKRNLIKCFLCFLVCLSACSKKDFITDANVIIKVPVNRSGDLFLKDYVDSVVYVKLETTANCLINRINRVNVFDNKIFIHDSKMKSVLVFDLKGYFLFKIQKVGMGPGEYNDITSFSIDRANKNIIIHDISKNSINKYCANTGRFKETIRIIERKSFARDILLMDNGDYLCYSSEYPGRAFCGIWLLNSNGEFKKHLWEQTKEYPYTPTDPNPMLIKELKNGVYSVFDVVNNIIYHYDGIKLTKAYQFDFSSIPATVLSDYPGISNMKRFEMKMRDIIEISYVQETSNFIWTVWESNSVGTHALFDKKEEKLIIAENTHLIDGVRGVIRPTDNSDIICFEIGAWKCENLLINDIDKEINSDVRRLMSITNKNDNSILQLFYMKR